MTSVFAARRRAEEFQALLDAAPEGSQPSERHEGALGTVRALQGVASFEPREEFVRDLRGRLMAEAATALADAPAPADLSARRRLESTPKRDKRFAAVLGSAALVGATASMGVAAQGALPGESLYPLKRALENAQVGAQGGDDEKGESLLANASRRLDEVDQLSRDGRESDPERISETLDSFTEQASEAMTLLLDAFEDTGRPSLVSDVRDFTSQSLGALRTLEPLVPTGSRTALVRASTALSKIDDEALRLCPSCSSVVLDPAPSLSSSSYDVLTDVIDDTPVPVEKPSNSAPSTQQKPTRPDGKASTGEGNESGKPAAPSTPTTPTEAPGTGSGSGTGQAPKPPRNLVKDLTDNLLGEKNTSGTKPKKPKNPLSGVTDPVEDLIRDVLP